MASCRCPSAGLGTVALTSRLAPAGGFGLLWEWRPILALPLDSWDPEPMTQPPSAFSFLIYKMGVGLCLNSEGFCED